MNITLRMPELFCISAWIETNVAGDENVKAHNDNSQASSNNTHLMGLPLMLHKITGLRLDNKVNLRACIYKKTLSLILWNHCAFPTPGKKSKEIFLHRKEIN